MNRSTLRSATAALLAGTVAATLLAACDTGDGKTLKNTVVPTTLPPPDTTPIESVALDSTDALGTDTLGGGSEIPVVPTESAVGPMMLVGPWNDGAPIDVLHTCDGEEISPALSWRAVPDGAVELALVAVDDDAGTPVDPVVHWVVAGFDPASISLAEGEVPIGAVQATNSFGELGWTGPCPPPGDGPHAYRFKLYALAQQVELGDGVPADEALAYLEGLTLAAAELTGTYER